MCRVRVNRALVLRNWLLGKRISEEIISKGNEENYGKSLIAKLSKQLTSEFGKGFTPSILYDCIRFHESFPDFLPTLSGKSFSLLSWSHYRTLLQVQDDEARVWYCKECSDQAWSVRALQRNIDSQYYYRMLKTPNPKAVKSELDPPWFGSSVENRPRIGNIRIIFH